MTTSAPLSHSTSTDPSWDNVWSPPTMPNSPTICSNQLEGPQPSTIIHAARNPKEISWFQLEILFCNTFAKGNIYHYDPIAIRKQESTKATIIFNLDRGLSREQNKTAFLKLIQLSNPRTRTQRETLDQHINGMAVRRPYDISGPGVRVEISGLITQLWETETYGVEAVSPDLFGTGGNEVHVLM